MNFIKNFINTTSIGALIAILVAINIVATFLPFKLDFTANRVFTINKVTKDIAKNLKDEVEIKVYLSETLPSRLLPLKQDLKDTLSLYNRLGKVKITYIDPKQDQKIRQEAYTDGVSPLRLSEVGSTKLEVSEAYFGLVVKSKMLLA